MTVLYLTNGSVDSSLIFRHWLKGQPATTLYLTVVLPYDIAADERLDKDVAHSAKETAEIHLQNWLVVVGDVRPHQLITQTLFASPEHALTIHLLLYRYDRLLVDAQRILTPLAGILAQTNTKPIELPGARTDSSIEQSVAVS